MRRLSELVMLRCWVTFLWHRIVLRITSKWIRSQNKNIGLFDLSNINFPLTLRKWEYGDFMKPLGTNGKKKISDILIDKKVSIVEKENIYVILSNNEIIWLIGYCISDKYKLNSITQNVLKITYFK